MKNKLKTLENIIAEMKNVLIAFSGGVDSSFLVKVARDGLHDNVLAVTAVSDIQPDQELEDAKQLTLKLGVKHILVPTTEMSDENFLSNPPDRCYICKKNIFSELKRIAIEKSIPFILDGSNADDLDDYRPGTRALRELNIRSPLREVGFTKMEIRKLSERMGLPTWEKPASACLASRIPYGDRITTEKLKRIDKAESFLREFRFKQVRVRDHNGIARIEVTPEEISVFMKKGFPEIVSRRFKEFGFIYVTLDMNGYRRGSLNKMLNMDG